MAENSRQLFRTERRELFALRQQAQVMR
jgi:hypothetical protein